MLEEVDVYAVTYEAEDGHRVWAASFTDRAAAMRYLVQHAGLPNARTVGSSLWQCSETGKYYRIEKQEIPVDIERHKQTALAKLTEDEKRALGF